MLPPTVHISDSLQFKSCAMGIIQKVAENQDLNLSPNSRFRKLTQVGSKQGDMAYSIRGNLAQISLQVGPLMLRKVSSFKRVS